MNQNDAHDRLIDEALRLATSGEPPAGYFERLQRRIAAAPETHRVRGIFGYGYPRAAPRPRFFCGYPAMLLHSSKPVRIAAVRESKVANLPAAWRAYLPPSRTKAMLLLFSDPVFVIRKPGASPHGMRPIFSTIR